MAASVYRPGWSAGCFGAGTDNAEDRANYGLYQFQLPTVGQFDTPASYRLPWGLGIFGYGLNVNNEVFGFYDGSPQYVVQREYYHPTYAGGIRWSLLHER